MEYNQSTSTRGDLQMNNLSEIQLTLTNLKHFDEFRIVISWTYNYYLIVSQSKHQALQL